MGQESLHNMSASKKPFDPIAFAKEITALHPNSREILRIMAQEMKKRGIKLREATKLQLVGLHDLAVEAHNLKHRIRPKPIPTWRSGRKARGYPRRN